MSDIKTFSKRPRRLNFLHLERTGLEAHATPACGRSSDSGNRSRRVSGGGKDNLATTIGGWAVGGIAVAGKTTNQKGTSMKWKAVGIVSIAALAAAINLPAQEGPKKNTDAHLGTWVLASSKYGAKEENFASSTQSAGRFKLFTQTHWMCGSINTATMKIKGVSHGGSYSLNGNTYVESVDFFGGSGTPAQTTFTLRVEGDQLFQSGLLIGVQLEEVYHRVKPEGMQPPRATAPAAAVAQKRETTLTGEVVCAKCVLKQTDTCQLALQVAAGVTTNTYLLAANAVRKQMEDRLWQEQKVDWCSKRTRVVATGIVMDSNGKPMLAASRLQQSTVR